MSARKLVVTVTATFDLATVESAYAEALTPDGGYVGTFNAYLAEYADGVVRDMRGIDTCEYSSSWGIHTESALQRTTPECTCASWTEAAFDCPVHAAAARAVLSPPTPEGGAGE